ncbi:MAG: 30S ribosome-binding factor RbfA [Defluviitaleaceae bacterium]|nr:30S ribosome-binding factor RbfA [Defluviitaleaceae bacterium]
MQKKNNNRRSRINDEVTRVLADIIRSELSDPRIGVVTSVTRAEVTPDMKYCKAYISILSDNKSDVMKGLLNAAGYIRKLLAERVNLRQTPELHFVHDDAVEHGLKISRLIDEVVKDIVTNDTDIKNNDE